MAVRFDAAADRLSYSGSAPPTTFTITAWVYLSVDRDDYSAVARLWTSAFATVATWETDATGTAGPHYYTSANSITVSTSLTVGTWRKVAITRTGTTAGVYSAPVGGVTVSNATTGVSSAVPAGITLGGRDTGDATEWLNGRLACVRVWDNVLTQAEIETEWANLIPVKTTGLWANWRLSSATDLTDTINGRTLATASGGSLTTEADPPVATRYYLPVSGTPGASPAFSSSWDVTTGASTSPAVTTKSNTATTSTGYTETVATSPVQVLGRQFVSATIGAQTISGTFSLVVSCLESTTSADASIQAIIRVVSGDGSTVRGTLYAGHSTALNATVGALGEEMSASASTRIMSAVALTSVTAQDGDRIVFELGARLENVTSVSRGVTFTFGDLTALADYALTSGLSTTLDPWLELSQTILAQGAGVTPPSPGRVQSYVPRRRAAIW